MFLSPCEFVWVIREISHTTFSWYTLTDHMKKNISTNKLQAWFITANMLSTVAIFHLLVLQSAELLFISLFFVGMSYEADRKFPINWWNSLSSTTNCCDCVYLQLWAKLGQMKNETHTYKQFRKLKPRAVWRLCSPQAHIRLNAQQIFIERICRQARYIEAVAI